MRAIRVGDVVKGSAARLERVTDGNLWYSVDFSTPDEHVYNWMFPVPFADTEGGIFRAEERPLYLMRWIRPQVAKYNDLHALKMDWDGTTRDKSLGTTVRNCARCRLDHGGIELEILTHPMAPSELPDWVWTHWFSCPVSGQPVMVIVSDDVVLTEVPVTSDRGDKS